MNGPMIAVCGIDCTNCPLLRASQGDEEAAEHLAAWWRNEGWLDEGEGADEVLAGGPHCLGCLGDRDAHWSANCWILTCCVDDHGLDSCHKCDDFACERLVEWAGQNDRYGAALNRLRQMREVQR
jgi:hypothetical protein